MVQKVETTISLDKTLLEQVEILAQRLNMTQTQCFEAAIERFVSAYQESSERVINQGDIFWLKTVDSEADIPHPHVVIQENVLNHSRIHTVVTCLLTSNLKRASMPGNVLLEAGEANLPKASVVEVSKVSTIDKSQLGEFVGTLSDERISQILAGMRFLQSSFFK